MKKIVAFFASKSEFNMNTEMERRRFAKSMPGEAGSLASLRLTGIGL